MLPTNIKDAAQALKSGDLGLIEEIKIGNILVSALTGLSEPRELDITEKPTGEGYSITDAAVMLPIVKDLTVCFANPTYSPEQLSKAMLSGDADELTAGWRDKKNELYEYQTERELITLLTHVDTTKNMLVQLIDPIYDPDNNWDGFFARVVLKQITTLTSEGSGGTIDSENEAVGPLDE